MQPDPNPTKHYIIELLMPFRRIIEAENAKAAHDMADIIATHAHTQLGVRGVLRRITLVEDNLPEAQELPNEQRSVANSP